MECLTKLVVDISTSPVLKRLVVYVLFICVFLFYEERASPGYLGFGVYLVIYLFSPAHLRAFVFYLELASFGYLGFGVYLIINLLSSDSLRDFLFYVDFGFWILEFT